MDDEDYNVRHEDVERKADDRLVHALLLHLHDPRVSERRELRVRRAMLALGEPAKATSPDSASRPAERALRFPAWARRSVWAAAATVLLVVGILALLYTPAPALASLNDILGALNRPGDRAYRIEVEPPDPEMQLRASLHGATLYLRDGIQYLLVRLDPKGGSQFDGYDGRQSWRISGGALAETKEGLGAGGLGMPQTMSDTLFADLQPTLERIKVDYAIEQFDQAPLPFGGAPLRHVLARRNSREIKGAETIEIWADSKTGMPRRIVFDQARFQGSPQPRRLTLDLVGESALPADWFSHEAHTLGRSGVGSPIH
jgi:hypothetical protein